jgi:hypothetical protein
MITHYLDLNVRTHGIHKEMQFLVTDIGHEEILLGYPWLAMFEPKFNWQSAVIDERVLPIVRSMLLLRVQTATSPPRRPSWTASTTVMVGRL